MSAAHTATSVLSEVPRRFSIQSSPELDIAFELNKELYFNPGEALGVGTIAGVGIGNTVFFSNPGVGITQKYVQTRNIYLPKHEFKTGDEVKYAAKWRALYSSCNRSYWSNYFQIWRRYSCFYC